MLRVDIFVLSLIKLFTLIARFMWPTWGPSGVDRTQVGPMLAHELCYQGIYRFAGDLKRHDFHVMSL